MAHARMIARQEGGRGDQREGDVVERRGEAVVRLGPSPFGTAGARDRAGIGPDQLVQEAVAFLEEDGVGNPGEFFQIRFGSVERRVVHLLVLIEPLGIAIDEDQGGTVAAAGDDALPGCIGDSSILAAGVVDHDIQQAAVTCAFPGVDGDTFTDPREGTGRYEAGGDVRAQVIEAASHFPIRDRLDEQIDRQIGNHHVNAEAQERGQHTPPRHARRRGHRHRFHPRGCRHDASRRGHLGDQVNAVTYSPGPVASRSASGRRAPSTKGACRGRR